MGALFELVCLLCQTGGSGALPPLFMAPLQLPPAELVAPKAVADSPTTQRASAAPAPVAQTQLAQTQPALGERWHFRDGRELRLYLTPTPAQCAPLMEVKF
jgi:hypothetical protein